VRWRALTGDRVRYGTSREAAPLLPGIPASDFASSVVLVEPGGGVFRGAEAVLRALAQAPGHGRWLRLYQRSPVAARAAECAYRFVARHRSFFTRVTRLLWGESLEPETFVRARGWFFLLLGLVYFSAFASLAVQVPGLIGADGITPAARLLDVARHELGSGAWLRFPTLFWLGSGDAMLRAVPIAGAALSLLLVLGILPALAAPLLWIGYLSLVTVGGEFLSFQWDGLLLEAGFLAMLLAPRGLRPLGRAPSPPPVVLFLFRWLLFRLMFASGAVKLLSGDPAWHTLRALEYHYETQPLPTVIGWYAHHLPAAVQHASAAAVLAIELAAPFLIFFPRRARHLGASVLIALQVLILATGNYAFFNLLTIALAVLVFDDRAFASRRGAPVGVPAVAPRAARERRGLRPAAIALLVVSLAHWWGSFLGWGTLPPPARSALATLAPWNLVNGYGLFAVMTTSRPEIVVEGSADGVHWRAYEFRWKPGDPARPPRWVAPYQPRLDWQMWFAALGSYGRTPWFGAFLARLLEGSPAVLALVGTNPFPDTPPRYVRATLYDYRFTDLATRRRTGAWWRREERGPYAPVLRSNAPLRPPRVAI
jgi:lipase maturation factor 1